jgi:tRNA (guanine26-N2/guanine27-N2)-dimethyltransferase
MSSSVHYQQITEGSTEVFVPEQKNKEKGPGKKHGLPFYNPAMELNRDLSIAVVQWLLSTSDKKHFSLLDGLAATGIRGIRFNHELSGSFDVTLNDWSEESFLVMKKNVIEKSLDNVTCTNQNLNALLLEEKFDYIDVDPFGSPVSFIDSAMKSIRHHGILAVSATDTACLCGVYPKVCLRRYAAYPLHGPVMHEVGLRILLGFVAREAAKHEVGIQPILSYKTDHYMRLYVQVHRNVPSANETAKLIQPLLKKDVYPFKDEQGFIGPLWMGSLHTKEIVTTLKHITETKVLGSKKKMMKLCALFEEEADAPLFYYTTNELGSLLRCSPPSLDRLWELFHKFDIPIFHTQFDPTGFKTPVSFDEVKSLFVKSCKNSM